MVTVHNFEKNKVSIPVKPIKIKPRIPPHRGVRFLPRLF